MRDQFVGAVCVTSVHHQRKRIDGPCERAHVETTCASSISFPTLTVGPCSGPAINPDDPRFFPDEAEGYGV